MGFSLLCLLATTILDSLFLFWLPNTVIQPIIILIHSSSVDCPQTSHATPIIAFRGKKNISTFQRSVISSFCNILLYSIFFCLAFWDSYRDFIPSWSLTYKISRIIIKDNERSFHNLFLPCTNSPNKIIVKVKRQMEIRCHFTFTRMGYNYIDTK